MMTNVVDGQVVSDINVAADAVGATVVETAATQVAKAQKPAKPAKVAKQKAAKEPKEPKVKAVKEPKPKKNRAIYTFPKALREKMTTHIQNSGSTKRAFVNDLAAMECEVVTQLQDLGFGVINAKNDQTTRCSVPVSDDLKACLDRMSEATGLQKQECLLFLINRKLNTAS